MQEGAVTIPPFTAGTVPQVAQACGEIAPLANAAGGAAGTASFFSVGEPFVCS
jgi:hypothetical protein